VTSHVLQTSAISNHFWVTSSVARLLGIVFTHCNNPSSCFHVFRCILVKALHALQ
jgi:hypothetical protein